jgi:glycosyltransferase involved in cell wall biosynthesis
MNDENLVLTPSRWCKSVFRDCGVTTPIEVIRHGLDPAYCTDLSLDTCSDDFAFFHFCSSGLHPYRKGTLTLIKAFELALERSREYFGSLLIYSDSKLIRNKVERSKHRVSINVFDEFFVGPKTMAKRLRLAKVLVAPSRAEGFGMVPLQALACGTPTIATACTGHAEWCSNGFIGLSGMVTVPTGDLKHCPPGPGLAPSLSIEDLADSLLYARETYAKLREEALNNSEVLRATWAWSEVLAPLIKILKD